MLEAVGRSLAAVKAIDAIETAQSPASLLPPAPDAAGRRLYYGRSSEGKAIDDSFLQTALHSLLKLHERSQMGDTVAHKCLSRATVEFCSYVAAIPVGTAFVENTIVLSRCPDESRPIARAFCHEHARNANNLDQLRLSLTQYLQCVMEYHRQIALQLEQDKQMIGRLRGELDDWRRHDGNGQRARPRSRDRDHDEERAAEERRFDAALQNQLAQMRIQEVVPLKRQLERYQEDCQGWSVTIADLKKRHRDQVEGLQKQNRELLQFNNELHQTNVALQQASQDVHQTNLTLQYFEPTQMATEVPSNPANSMPGPSASAWTAQGAVDESTQPLAL